MMSDFFDFTDAVKETLGAKKKAVKKTVAKKATKAIGKCAFIDGLIRKGLDKDMVTTKTIAKFPDDIADKTRNTVNARYSALKGEDIKKPRPAKGTKINVDKEGWPTVPFSCCWNPRKSDYEYYWE